VNFKNIKGGKELLAELHKMPAKLEANVMRAALRAGAAVIKAEVLQNVPVGTPAGTSITKYGSYAGALRDSVRVRVQSRAGRLRYSVRAGNEKAWYWRFVEFGTQPHEIRAHGSGRLYFNGYARGAVQHPGAAPHPFMRPAYDSKAGAAIEAVRATIRAKLASKRFTRDWGTSAPPEDAA
jgi:HK97 gp10 family phage protein